MSKPFHPLIVTLLLSLTNATPLSSSSPIPSPSPISIHPFTNPSPYPYVLNPQIAFYEATDCSLSGTTSLAPLEYPLTDADKNKCNALTPSLRTMVPGSVQFFAKEGCQLTVYKDEGCGIEVGSWYPYRQPGGACEAGTGWTPKGYTYLCSGSS